MARHTTKAPSAAARKTKAAAPNGNGKARKANGKGGGGSAYDAFKDFEGQRYTGMKIGRGHKWIYDAGEWTERKVTPDKWEIRYAVTKRRKGKAPEGSGVPVGTEYHWYILAHQTVKKLDANSYTTELVGFKHKLAHKRADKPTWSASDNAQRKHLIRILEGLIGDLRKQVAAEAPAAKRVSLVKERKRKATARDKHLAAA